MAPPAPVTGQPKDAPVDVGPINATVELEPKKASSSDSSTASQSPDAPKYRLIKTGETTVSITPPEDRFVLRPGLSVTPLAGIGGKNASLFDKAGNSNTAHGAYTFVDLSLAADFKLTPLGNWGSLFLGPRLAYQAHRGDRATGGSSMDLGQLDLSLGFDWKNSMAGWPVLLPSRISLYGGLLYGSGETTAGEHFSVAPTRGLGYALGAEADLFGVKVNKAGDSVQFSWYAETGHIPNARGDNPYSFWSTGPRITVPLAWPGSIQKESRVDTLLCRADNDTIVKLKDRVQNLLSSAQAAYTTYNSFAELLKKEFNERSIRGALRAGKVKALTLAETSKLKAANPEMKQEDLDKAIAAKKDEFKAAAEAAYPGDYNHYEIKWPTFALNLDTLEIPTDCDDQEKLYDQLTDMKEKLIEVTTRVEERTHWVYIELGRKAPPPPISVALDFPMTLFDTARPNDAATTKKYADDVKRIKDYMTANASKFPITNPEDSELLKAFGPIFKGNKAAKQRQINHLFTNAQILQGKQLPRNIDSTKLAPGEDGRIKTFMQTIDVRIEAHTSKSGVGKDPNSPEDPMMKLSQRRADAIIDLLVAFGVDRSRLTGIGYGFSRPADETDNGNESQPAAVINRRLVFMIDPKGRHVHSEEPPPPAKATPDAGDPSAVRPDAGAPTPDAAAPKK